MSISSLKMWSKRRTPPFAAFIILSNPTVDSSTPNMSCRVKGCRFAVTHTTAGHRCGTCGSWAHGQLECGNASRLHRLSRFCHETMPQDQHCDRVNCTHPWSHTRAAHFCTTCQNYGDFCRCVPIVTRECPSCKQDSEVNLSQKLFTGADCIVCYDTKPLVLFGTCGHVNVCADCVVRL